MESVLDTVADTATNPTVQENSETTSVYITREEFNSEIIALRSEFISTITSLQAIIDELVADNESFLNRIATFNQRSTHKL